ncbi:hypothetical protein LPJ64_004581 [Coemansia asiatica]|uniref:Uncharacterized protein n=1 Tax=Coemansia asiatica TaxID=1052880 RepID=A0A9W7XIT2_9FUNG|nr:hypothetical protein LPJ64_004581 [Coemansia asiatica]
MSRRITNFDYEIYPPESGFQSICARTLPGRTANFNGWCDSSWPRFNFGSDWPHHHTMAAPPSYHHQHHHHGHHGQHNSHMSPFYPHRHHHQQQQQQQYPSIMGGFFDPPPQRRATEVETFADRQVIRLRSDVFRDVKPTVQVKGDGIRVFAARVRTGTGKHGTVRQDNEFEYSTTVSPAFDVRRVMASRHGDELVITVPRK